MTNSSTSIFHKENDNFLEEPESYINYLKQHPQFKNTKLISGEIYMEIRDKDKPIKMFAILYPDRIELYKNADQNKLILYIKNEGKTIVIGDSLSVKKLHNSFNGFILATSQDSSLFYFRTYYDFKAWKPYLKQSFVQNYEEFRSNYLVRKNIGKGAYASIYQAKNWMINNQVAVKVFNKDTIKEHSYYLKLIERELECLKFWNYHKFAQLYEIIEGENHIYIVMEYFKYGDLFTFIKKQDLNEKQILQIIYKILKQLKILHDHQIYHGDIKLDNIMIQCSKNDEIYPVLIDFGFAQMNNINEEKLTHLIGTSAYASPEILQGYIKHKCFQYTEKCEIFSLGVVFFCMLFKGYPFEVNLDNPTYEIFYPETQRNFSMTTINLLKNMLEINPEKRISLTKLLLNQLFQTHQENSKKFVIRKTSTVSIILPKTLKTKPQYYLRKNYKIVKNKKVSEETNDTVSSNDNIYSTRNIIQQSNLKNKQQISLPNIVFSPKKKEQSNMNFGIYLSKRKQINLMAQLKS